MYDPTRTQTPSELTDRAPTPEVCQRIALARATLARFIAECFTGGVPCGRASLHGPDVRRELEGAAKTLGLSRGLAKRLLASVERESLIEDMDQILGHSVRSSCPPYELEYLHGEIFQQSQTLADIAGFYSAFGFEVNGPLAERPDHIVPEWEFLCVLAYREYQALCVSDAAAVETCRDGQRAFLSDHASRWMPAFFARIRKASQVGPLASTSELASAVLTSWCAQFEIRPGSSLIELRQITEDDAAITCGAPDAGQVELGPVLAAAVDGRGAR